MKQKSLAFLLLIAFGVLLTPRIFWHECSDEHPEIHSTEVSDNNHSDSDQPHFDENCFACDYDMDVVTHPISFKYRFQQPNYFVSQELAQNIVSLQKVETHCLRGPPRA